MSTRKGFWEINERQEIFHDVLSRDDIRDSPAQAALARAHEGLSRLACPCQRERPQLIARKIGQFYACVRARVSEHDSTCSFTELYGEAVTLSSSVFSLSRSRESNLDEGDADDVSGRTLVCLPFSGFAARLAAEAATGAFIASNPNFPPRVQPTHRAFFSAWEAVLAIPRFEGGRDATAAARLEGVDLKIGIIFRPPCPGREAKCLVGGFWWDGRNLGSVARTADTRTVVECLDALRGRNHLLPPPYLAIAVVEPDGHLRKLWLKGIWTDGEHLAFADSVTERRCAWKLTARGDCFFKPLLTGDPAALAAYLPPLLSGPHWRYRPDFIVWRPSAGAPHVVTVMEVRGFKPGEDPDYDQGLVTNEPYYRALGPDWAYQVEDGGAIQEKTGCQIRKRDGKILAGRGRFQCGGFRLGAAGSARSQPENHGDTPVEKRIRSG